MPLEEANMFVFSYQGMKYISCTKIPFRPKVVVFQQETLKIQFQNPVSLNAETCRIGTDSQKIISYIAVQFRKLIFFVIIAAFQVQFPLITCWIHLQIGFC